MVRWEIQDSPDVTNPSRVRVGTNEYFYLYPNYRVRADFASLTNLAEYDACTGLAPGAGYHGAASLVDRSPEGMLRYDWRRKTCFRSRR